MKSFITSLLILPTLLLFLLGFSETGLGLEESHSTQPARTGNQVAYENFTVLFGDPHFHSNLSDGDESPDFGMRFARDVASLDWACLSDHADFLELSAREYYRSIPDKYNDPGVFSVLFAYEWTSHYYGHRNVYTLDNTIPILSNLDADYSDPEGLWANLAGYDVITVPHHPMIWSTDLWYDHVNPAVEFNVEFYSKWGMSLYDGNERPMLAARPGNAIFFALGYEGLRYGLMAGTDSHMTRPGSFLGESRQDNALPYSRPGLTAVWATSNTREAIFDALKNRRCYGVTGTRIVIEFSVNDSVMGSEITSSNPPVIEFSASSDEIITEISILRIDENGIAPIREYSPNAVSFDGTYTDNDFTQDEAYSLMVNLENTDCAMVSPIWVEKI